MSEKYESFIKLVRPYNGQLSGSQMRELLKEKHGIHVSQGVWNRACKECDFQVIRNRSKASSKNKPKPRKSDLQDYTLSSLSMKLLTSNWQKGLML